MTVLDETKEEDYEMELIEADEELSNYMAKSHMLKRSLERKEMAIVKAKENVTPVPAVKPASGTDRTKERSVNLPKLTLPKF